jgi:hypothetical protein
MTALGLCVLAIAIRYVGGFACRVVVAAIDGVLYVIAGGDR